MYSSGGLLVISIKLKVNEDFRKAAMMLCYILRKNRNKVCVFSKLCYYMSLLGGDIVSPTSEVYASA